jgi:membrane-associated phospholipid phosphatase
LHVGLIVGGYFFVDKKVFLGAAYLVGLSKLLNFALKVFFQVPSLEGVISSSGYGFPSGHMQTFTSLYLYIWLQYPRFFAPFLLLLPALAWGMIYMKYHTLFDVIGGLIVAGALVLCYNKFIASNKLLKIIIPLLLLAWIYYFAGYLTTTLCCVVVFLCILVAIESYLLRSTKLQRS